MHQEQLDRVLRAAEEEIVPSSNFTGAVMEAVRREAVAPPLSFPWKCALPGIALAAFAVVALLLMPSQANGGTVVLASTHLAVMLTALSETARRFGVNWLLAALLLAWTSMKLSMQLASWKS